MFWGNAVKDTKALKFIFSSHLIIFRHSVALRFACIILLVKMILFLAG